MTCRTWVLAALMALACGCGDDESARGRDGGGGSAADGGGGNGGGVAVPPAPAITWTACPATDTAGFECADVPVPLDWGQLEGPTMSVRIRRHVAAVDPPRGSVWMLEGGPGAPASWILPYALQTSDAHPDLDVVVVEHRGP